MEIVGPAGNFEKMKAAIKGGATEVYFGLKGFGARRNNDNFNLKEILDAIDYAHSKGVKTLLTLNTVMKDVELINAYKNFLPLYKHGIDAVIVQDIGFIKYLKEKFPKLIIHGSTQMTVANHVEANFLKSLGLTRVVLARELSFEEIKEIRENTDIELEVFVSGSMCISYSGNCYISSFIGGRSGNRGMCAYTCRKKFKDEVGNYSYILSPNDQLLKEKEIDKLKEIGIDAIKVEGRKKQEQYVYETVSYYRSILDGNPKESNTYKLFNRGYSKGYFYLDNNLMNHNYPSNFGYLIGVVDKNRDVKLLDDLILGDGIQYVDHEFKVLSGEYVNKIKIKNEKKEIANKGDLVTLNLPKYTKYIYKNYSKKINDEINHKLKVLDKKIPVDISLKILNNENLEIEAVTENIYGKKIKAHIKSEILTEKANKIIEYDQLKQKISELGNTNFYLDNFYLEYDNYTFVPISLIKQLKRDVIEKLNDNLITSYRREVSNEEIDKIKLTVNEEKKYIISALVETEEQERACREFNIQKIYKAGYDIAKQKNLKFDEINNNGNLIYNFYHLKKGQEQGLKNQSINWNLNIFNNYAIKMYENFSNVETLFLSPELNKNQLKRLSSDKLKLGLVIYGRLKGMYIEHTIFEKEYKEIEGEFFDRYKLKRNKLNNIELYMHMPMNLIPKLDEVEKLGLDELRLDFTFETYEETKKILKSLKDRSGKYVPYAFEDGVS